MILLMATIGIFVGIFRSISSIKKGDKRKFYDSLLMILIWGIALFLFILFPHPFNNTK